MLNWSSNPEEIRIQGDIARRAVQMSKGCLVECRHMEVVMDIDACHSNGCPLKLQELLEADDVGFAHDIFGIRANIDRTTGKLQSCFLPRYAKQE